MNKVAKSNEYIERYHKVGSNFCNILTVFITK